MSQIGELSVCLVDGDAEALERARRLRRKAVAISIALQAAALAALLVWPLVTPGELPRQFNITPAPPFPGGGSPKPAHPTAPRNRHWPQSVGPNQLRFPTMNARQQQANEPDAPDLDFAGGGSGPAIPGATGEGPYIPGALGDRSVAPPPPEQMRRPESVHRSEGVMEAMLVRRVQPIYPPVARIMHLSGIVILHATIGTDGAVHKLSVMSGNPILVQAAVAAVRDWRYRPTLLSGQPVEVETEITVKFILD